MDHLYLNTSYLHLERVLSTEATMFFTVVFLQSIFHLQKVMQNFPEDIMSSFYA